MHEIGITKDLVDLAQKQIEQRAGVCQVKAVHVRLGRGLGISEESLEFWFNHFSVNTRVQGAKVKISIVDGSSLDLDSLEVE